MGLIRDPADWAREWGWVSPLRRARAVKRLRTTAEAIRGALDDEGADLWADELDSIAAYLEKKQR